MTRSWSRSVSSVAQGSETPAVEQAVADTAAEDGRPAKGGWACSGRHRARAPTPGPPGGRKSSRPRPVDSGTSTE